MKFQALNHSILVLLLVFSQTLKADQCAMIAMDFIHGSRSLFEESVEAAVAAGSAERRMSLVVETPGTEGRLKKSVSVFFVDSKHISELKKYNTEAILYDSPQLEKNTKSESNGSSATEPVTGRDAVLMTLMAGANIVTWGGYMQIIDYYNAGQTMSFLQGMMMFPIIIGTTFAVLGLGARKKAPATLSQTDLNKLSHAIYEQIHRRTSGEPMTLFIDSRVTSENFTQVLKSLNLAFDVLPSQRFENFLEKNLPKTVLKNKSSFKKMENIATDLLHSKMIDVGLHENPPKVLYSNQDLFLQSASYQNRNSLVTFGSFLGRHSLLDSQAVQTFLKSHEVFFLFEHNVANTMIDVPVAMLKRDGPKGEVEIFWRPDLNQNIVENISKRLEQAGWGRSGKLGPKTGRPEALDAFFKKEIAGSEADEFDMKYLKKYEQAGDFEAHLEKRREVAETLTEGF